MGLTAPPKGEPLACRFWMCWMKKPHFAQAAGLRCNGQQKLALRVKSVDAANEDRGPAVREPQGDHTDLPGLPRALPLGELARSA